MTLLRPVLVLCLLLAAAQPALAEQGMAIDPVTERGEQWGRLEREGITETLRVEKPSGILYDFLFKGFGFLAVSVGIILTLLMVYAFLVA